MRRTSAILGVLALLAAGAPASASDPVGVYAVVDRVVFEPGEKEPAGPGALSNETERVQLWGAFALAKDGTREEYEEPRVGYMYFSLPVEQKDVARKEWADMKEVAEAGECIAFAARHKPKGKVRKAAEKPADPDPYPLSWGLQKVRKTRERSPVRELISLALPLSPRGDVVAPGSVTLTVRNIADRERKGVRYVFEVKSESGETEKSPEIAPGKEKTEWTPTLRVSPGEKYVWLARAVEGDWKGPAAETTFAARGGKG